MDLSPPVRRPPRGSPAAPRRASGAVLAALLGFLPLLCLDPFTPPLRSALAEHSWLRDVLDPLRDFGLLFTQALVLFLVWLLDPTRRRCVLVGAAAVLLSNLPVQTLKAAVGRMRPEAGAGVLQFTAPWPPARLVDDRRKSFPSGHAASAFALAGVLAQAYPRGRVGFFLLAGGCAATRVLDGRHFPTDVYAGALLGLCSAWWCIARLSSPPAEGEQCDPASNGS